MKKILLFLLLLPCLVRAQTESITYQILTVGPTGHGSGSKTYAPGVDATVDSVWTAMLSSHTIGSDDIWSAQKLGTGGFLAPYTRDASVLWPYQVAGGFTSATVSSGGAIVPSASLATVAVANGGTGSTTFTGARTNLGIITVINGADTSTTGQTLVGTPLQFAVGASQTWQFELAVYDSSSSSAGVKFGYAIPTSATIVSLGMGQTTGVTAFTSDMVVAGATAGLANATQNSALSLYFARGTVTTGATSGTVILQFLKATSGTAIVKAGSYLVARRVS